MEPTGETPPPRSALTARLVLAGFGFVVCTVGAIIFARAKLPPAFTIALIALAVIAIIDIVVVGRRKLHGERG
jgi:hypothetical protein